VVHYWDRRAADAMHMLHDTIRDMTDAQVYVDFQTTSR
jgi:hypothetical protein